MEFGLSSKLNSSAVQSEPMPALDVAEKLGRESAFLLKASAGTNDTF